MATEEAKKARQLKLCNNIVFGFAKGMYDLFGDSALATVDEIGKDIIEEMEHEMGLEIHGEDPQTILTEVGRLLIDEYDLGRSAKLTVQDQMVNVTMNTCMFWHATMELKKEGVPPYTCVPMMIAGAAMRKRLGKKAHFAGIEQDENKCECSINFRMS